jgi:hypothetical protein
VRDHSARAAWTNRSSTDDSGAVRPVTINSSATRASSAAKRASTSGSKASRGSATGVDEEARELAALAAHRLLEQRLGVLAARRPQLTGGEDLEPRERCPHPREAVERVGRARVGDVQQAVAERVRRACTAEGRGDSEHPGGGRVLTGRVPGADETRGIRVERGWIAGAAQQADQVDGLLLAELGMQAPQQLCGADRQRLAVGGGEHGNVREIDRGCAAAQLLDRGGDVGPRMLVARELRERVAQLLRQLVIAGLAEHDLVQRERTRELREVRVDRGIAAALAEDDDLELVEHGARGARDHLGDELDRGALVVGDHARAAHAAELPVELDLALELRRAARRGAA